METSKTLPASSSLLFALCFGILSAIGWYYTNSLPEALSLTDELRQPHRFIAERAKNHSMGLSNLGPKVVGSYTNQVLAKNFLLTEIERIRAGASRMHKLEVDVQRATGAFNVIGMQSVYRDIENVIVRLSPALVQPKYSVLINSHFDSVPVSNGGGDALLMVAVMLETLRVFASTAATHDHSIVFLFNGAEEAFLQGSHAFITQHKWAPDVRAYVNLDSAGSGGKDALFQMTGGHGWLMDYYKRVVPHPSTSVMTQEFFQRGLIPSDTDFRIFRDFGGIPGVDIATSKNGYVYHTRFDRADIIPVESFQNVGDNVLALADALANAPELDNVEQHISEDIIFFDFIGIFVVTLTNSKALIVYGVVSAVTISLIVLSLSAYAESCGLSFGRVVGDFIHIFIVELISIGLAAGLLLGSAFGYDYLHHSMAWFSNRSLVLGMYLMPCLLALSLGPAVYFCRTQSRQSQQQQQHKHDKQCAQCVHNEEEDSTKNDHHNSSPHKKPTSLKRSIHVQMFLHAFAVVLTALLWGLIYLRLQSAYMLCIGLTFYAVSLLVNYVTQLITDETHWIYVHLVGQIAPFTFYMANYLDRIDGLVPVQGRSGMAMNPENTIALFTLGFGLLMSGFLMPVFVFVRRPFWMAGVLGCAWLLTAGLTYTSVGFPYRPNLSEQRFWIYHTDRTFHAFLEKTAPVTDSGYFMIDMDRHTNEYINGTVGGVSSAVSTATFCDKYLYCGLPLYTSRHLRQTNSSSWVPAGSPHALNFTKLTLISVKNTAYNIKQYTFELKGDDHMEIFISPYDGSAVLNWTLSAAPIQASPTVWHGRPTYLVFLTSGRLTQITSRFTIDVQTNVALDKPSMDIAVVGHRVHNDDEQTDEFRAFLASFPRWAHVTPWMSSYESWKH